MNCNVIKDLLELYADGVVSKDTRELVDEHLAECESCAARLAQIQGAVTIPARVNVKPLKKIRKKIKLRFVAYGAIILPMLITILYFTVWLPLRYSEYIPPPIIPFEDVAIEKIEITTSNIWRGAELYEVEALRVHFDYAQRYGLTGILDFHNHDDNTYEYHFGIREWKRQNDVPCGMQPFFDFYLYRDDWSLVDSTEKKSYNPEEVEELRQTLEGFHNGRRLTKIYYCSDEEGHHTRGSRGVCDPEKLTLIWERE